MEIILSPEARSKLNLGYTSNPVAYELYMKAYYEFTSYSRPLSSFVRPLSSNRTCLKPMP